MLVLNKPENAIKKFKYTEKRYTKPLKPLLASGHIGNNGSAPSTINYYSND